MIISASRRTDIPTYYSEWFFNRLEEGYVLVRNPMNAHQVSKVQLTPDVVDGIVFWTKNPIPMMKHLDRLKDYKYYFQFTLNAYGRDVERNVPSKNDCIIPAFQKLSDTIGPERVIWRYDPIFLNEQYTVDYHIRYFEQLAKHLAPYTRKCVFSFLDLYPKIKKNVAGLELHPFPLEQQRKIAEELAGIAHGFDLKLETCAEGIDLKKYGIEHGRCIDDRLFSKLLGADIKLEKDKNQREECGCVSSIDIGTYNTCKNGCRYCYANFNDKSVMTNCQKHNPDSPLLLGEIGPEDKITDRKMWSCIQRPDPQISLFD